MLSTPKLLALELLARAVIAGGDEYKKPVVHDTTTVTDTTTVQVTHVVDVTVKNTKTEWFTESSTNTLYYTVFVTDTVWVKVVNTKTDWTAITNTLTDSTTITTTDTNSVTITNTETDSTILTNTETDLVTITSTETDSATITNTETDSVTITNTETDSATITNTETDSVTITNTDTTTTTVSTTTYTTRTIFSTTFDPCPKSCSISAETVNLYFWPTDRPYTYPSTYVDPSLHYTFTSPSVYVFIPSAKGTDTLGQPTGPSTSSWMLPLVLHQVSTIAYGTNITRQLTLADLGTDCPKTADPTAIATMVDSRCNPILAAPRQVSSWAYPCNACGRFGMFDPPYAVPAITGSLVVPTVSPPPVVITSVVTTSPPAVPPTPTATFTATPVPTSSFVTVPTSSIVTAGAGASKGNSPFGIWLVSGLFGLMLWL